MTETESSSAQQEPARDSVKPLRVGGSNEHVIILVENMCGRRGAGSGRRITLAHTFDDIFISMIERANESLTGRGFQCRSGNFCLFQRDDYLVN